MRATPLPRKRYLNLVKEFTFVQFTQRDQRTLLGLIYSFLYPLVMMALLYIVFEYQFAASIENFAVYLIIGLTHLAHFSNATASSIYALPNSRPLVVNSVFPAEVLILSKVLADTLELVISLLLCLLIAHLAGVKLHASVLWLPVIVLMQTLLVMWVSLILAAMCAFIADIGHIYQLFLRMLIFITPVFYSLSLLGDSLARKLALANPLTHLMMFSRTVILKGESIPPWASIEFLVVNGLLLLGSLAVFRALEPRFAEKF